LDFAKSLGVVVPAEVSGVIKFAAKTITLLRPPTFMKGAVCLQVLAVNEIFRAIVVSNAVFVVNLLSPFELPTQNLFHHQTVLVDVPFSFGIPRVFVPSDFGHTVLD
jgi:hypothetical protein